MLRTRSKVATVGETTVGPAAAAADEGAIFFQDLNLMASENDGVDILNVKN